MTIPAKFWHCIRNPVLINIEKSPAEMLGTFCNRLIANEYFRGIVIEKGQKHIEIGIVCYSKKEFCFETGIYEFCGSFENR